MIMCVHTKIIPGLGKIRHLLMLSNYMADGISFLSSLYNSTRHHELWVLEYSTHTLIEHSGTLNSLIKMFSTNHSTLKLSKN